jgi:hypothetical protein
MTERTERCETCRWWESIGEACSDADETRGWCRRSAPQPVITFLQTAACHAIGPEYVARIHRHDSGVTWPETAPDDWCGEYQPTPPEAAAKKGKHGQA